jgi:mannose-1-phosphate guanylyltransferase
VALGISPARTLFVVTRTDARFYAPLLADVWSRQLVVQPDSRGTAPAILYALLRLATVGHTDPVAFFPSDHLVSDDETCMSHVGAAIDATFAQPERLVLLGVTPGSATEDYGWIEPGPPIVERGHPWPGRLCRVRRFWAQPEPEQAQDLRARGALRNSRVMVGRVDALIRLIKAAVPELYQAFLAVRSALGTAREAGLVRELYARLPATDFSRRVLESPHATLAVLPVRGVGWLGKGQIRERLEAAVPTDSRYADDAARAQGSSVREAIGTGACRGDGRDL